MLRIGVLASLSTLLAVLVLWRLEGGLQVTAWLLVVAAATTFVLRGAVGGNPEGAASLLARRPGRSAETPAYWADAGLVVRASVFDAQAGRLRLRPYLQRIVEHRLARRGIQPGSDRAGEALGDEVMAVLRGDPGPLEAAELSRILDRLERL